MYQKKFFSFRDQKILMNVQYNSEYLTNAGNSQNLVILRYLVSQTSWK